MSYEILDSLRHLADEELVARTKSLAARERDATALLVAHLAELDTRDLHFRAGYASLFAYCRDALSLSEPDAYNAVEAARASRRFPGILGRLGSGSLNLTTVRLLAPHLTAENHRAVLDSAHGKTRPEVEQIVAGLSPRPDVAASLRKLPGPRLPAGAATRRAGPRRDLPGRDGSGQRPAPHSPPGGRAALARPLPPPGHDRGRDPREAAAGPGHAASRDSLRGRRGHSRPGPDRPAAGPGEGEVRGHGGAAPLPRDRGGPLAHVPAEVKRAVWLRDLGCCAFVGTGGRRCAERAFVEFHHVRPFAVGGEATVDNIQLRCRRHNDYEARVFFARDPPGLPERAGTTPAPP